MQQADVVTVAVQVAVPAIVALVVTLLTNKLTRDREMRARAVQSRRAAVLDLQGAVIEFRVARNRYGADLNRALGERQPGGAHVLAKPEVAADVDQAVFEANTAYDAALARLDAKEAAVTTAVAAWSSASFVASMSREVEATDEQAAFDAVNAAVRQALASIGT